jgi:hypothetical protein
MRAADLTPDFILFLVHFECRLKIKFYLSSSKLKKI